MKIALLHISDEALQLCRSAIDRLVDFELLWSARTVDEALKKTTLAAPDLIVIGLELAADAVKKLVKESPSAILIVTFGGAAQIEKVFEAMGDGALDVVSLEPDETGTPEKFIQKLIILKNLVAIDQVENTPLQHSLSHTQTPPLVVFGCSTGGPSALQSIFENLGDKIDFAAIVVQHVDAKFASGLAEWLGKHSKIPIRIAASGAVPEVGVVLIASATDHLIMTRNCRLAYTPYPLEKCYCPSVDVFFESLAEHWPGRGVALLLTGMGSDGAIGLKLLREKGWHTIVEHQDSCIVYGMPKAALALDAADEVLPLQYIPITLQNRARSP